MFRLRAVVDMTFGQRAGGGQDAGTIGKAANHDGQAGHELAALLGHIAVEQRLYRRSDVEKPRIESLDRLVRDRDHQRKGLLNERHLLRKSSSVLAVCGRSGRLDDAKRSGAAWQQLLDRPHKPRTPGTVAAHACLTPALRRGSARST